MALTSALERRFHPSNPDRWFLRHFGNEPSAAGVTVTEETALSATAVWAGVRIISETLAMLPLELYERVDDRTKKQARNLGLWKLLHDEPNPEQTSFEFREMQQGFLLLWGNCYAQKIVNGRGEVSELWPLVPWRVMPERSPNNTLVYRVTLPDNGGQTLLPADDVLHIKGFTSSGILGDNVVEKFRNSIGLYLAAEEFGARFFGNGLSASGGLKIAGKLGPDGRKNVRESFDEAHRGVERAHRMMILEEGLEWFQMTVDPQKAQAIETRKFQVTEVARILRLPPHLLYDLERSTFTNIEHQGQEFVTYSMQPWLTRWEHRLNRSLLLPSQRSKYFSQFEVRGLLRGDAASRSSFYKQMFDVGVYSPNDIRYHEGEAPVEGGDQRFVQMNLTPIDRIADMVAAQLEAKTNPPVPPAPEPTADPEPDDSAANRGAVLEPVVRAEIVRIVRRQAKAARAALKKSTQEFRIWADSFFERETDIVTEALSPVLRSLSTLVGRTIEARQFAAADTSQALTDVRDALKSPDELEKRISEVTANWETKRVESLITEILK